MYLSNKLMTVDVSDIKLHLKLESLLKEEPIVNWSQQ